MINPQQITITQHAAIRFRERWEGDPPECFMAELHRLLQAAQAEDLGHGTVVRMITNGFQSAAYYTAEGWRFVLDEEKTKLLTCERPYLKKQRVKRKLYNKRQKH